MKRKLPVLFLTALLCCSFLFLPVSAENNFSESATSQTFYALTAYSRMCKGLSPFYVLDTGAGKKDGYAKKGSVDRVQKLIDGIVAFKKGSGSVQGWINSGLVSDVAKGAEWYAMTLSQSGNYDFSAYRKALLSYLQENPPGAVQTAQKFALTLIATGSEDPLIQEIADRSIATSPVMAQVYGLHLINNGVKSASYTADTAKTKLLAMQMQDGGWAVMGQYGDVDVTAMVLEALAPYYNESSIKAAADRAISLLSSRQNADGSFSSMGKVNCESTAQVIMALSDLRIDCATDARFIKNGKSPLDALRQFCCSNGSFSHLALAGASQSGKASSAAKSSKQETSSGKAKQSDSGKAATAQKKKKASSKKEKVQAEEKEAEKQASDEKQDNSTDRSAESSPNIKTTGTQKRVPYKPILAGVLLVIGAGTAMLLAFLKKMTKKNILLLCGILAVSLVFVFFTNFESIGTHKKIAPKTKVVGTVTLSIRCDTVAGKGDADYIPKDGCMLKPTAFEIEEGDTVYDVLAEATKRFSLHMEKKGADGMVYVAAIGHLYELQFGEMSGWVYHVNGESPFVGCDSYTLSDGDTVEWLYTLDLGADVGNTFGEDE